MSIYKSPLCSCVICREVKSARGVHTHYAMHDPNILEKTLKNLKLACDSARIKNKQNKNDRLETAKTEYEKSPNKCAFCKCDIPFEKRNNKCCSKTCAAQHSNKSRKDNGWVPSTEQRQKTSNTLKNRQIQYKKTNKSQAVLKQVRPKVRRTKNKIAKRCYVEFFTCENCSNSFVRRFGKGSRKYCSEICAKDGKSRKARNNINLGSRRSKHEIELFTLCENYFGKVLSNPALVDGWDCDIFIEDLNIAILWNGPWHYKEMNFGNHSLSQVKNRDNIKKKLFARYGIQVYVFEDRYFTPNTAFEYILSCMTGGICTRNGISPPVYETGASN